VQFRDGESLREAKERETRERKHKIMLVPSEETEGTYSLWARLTPSPTWQQWLKDVPLDWAQQHAEIKADLPERLRT
jgi:hypothetical protein